MPKPKNIQHALQTVINNYEKRNKTPAPVTRAANLFFAEVKKYLPYEDQRSALKFYNALSSGLDIYYKIDGFFMLGRRVAGFDLTTVANPKNRWGSSRNPSVITISKHEFDYHEDHSYLAQKIAGLLLNGRFFFNPPRKPKT